MFYYGWWWWWWVGVAVLIIIGLWLLYSWSRWRRPPGAGRGPGETRADLESARRILDERYARGEITREQYEQMRHDLENRNAA